MTVTAIPYRTKGLDHVVLRAKDIDKMLDFYSNVLGLPVRKHNEATGLWHLQAGYSMIDLVDMNKSAGQAGGPPPNAGRNVDHIALKIEPFDADTLRAYFASQAVNMERVQIRFGADGDGPSVCIKDPEGNGVELKGVI